MEITLKKHRDKPPTLTCKRDDGSVTWESYGNQGAFFPIHDLTHFVVETELGFGNAFFGMIANGRKLGDFGPGDAASFHTEAIHSEMLVGLLTTTESNGGRLSFAYIKGTIDEETQKIGIPTIELSEIQLDVIRARVSMLADRWANLPAGSVLSLSFPA